MKQYFYLSICILILINLSVAKAQMPVTLAEDSVKFGSRYFPGYWLSIPEAKPEVVKANWIKAVEKGTKSKVQINNNEITLFGAILPNFKAGSVNIMSKLENGDSLVQLFVSVESARDVYIGVSSEEYDILSDYLKKFGKDQYIIVAKEQLSVEQSSLKKLEKEFKSARRDKGKFEKSIQSSKVNITQQKDKINSINKEIEMLDIKIDNSTTLLSTMDDGDAKKSKKSELKSLQKKKKSLLKAINSAESRISKANTSIGDNNKNIDLNGTTQSELSDKITKQKLSVDLYSKKLKTIEEY